MIKIIVGNVRCRIVGSIDDSLLKKIDLKMSYKFPGYQYMKYSQGVYNPYSSNSGGWDGRFRLLTKSKAFPSGLLSLCEKILVENGVMYEVVDNREEVLYGESLSIQNKEFEPRDYQLEVIERAHSRGSGIVRSATGSGKTAMIAMLVARYNIPTVIYVIGIELLFQMKDTIESLYGIECGIVGGGHCDTSKDVCIMTIWSAASAFNKKCKLIDNDSTQDSKAKNKSFNKMQVRERVSSANMIIVDECQYAASETVQFIHKASTSARHKFLFSGTRRSNAQLKLTADISSDQAK